MINVKPELDSRQVQIFLENYYNDKVQDLELIDENNYVNKIYSYKVETESFIIRFNQDRESFDIHNLLYKTYGIQGVPMAKVRDIGILQGLFYCILEEIPGITLNKVAKEKFNIILPNLLETVYKVHAVHVGNSKGYGTINRWGNGIYESWSDYVKNYFSNDMEGFWNNWHQLYDTTFLEKNVFDEFYNKMLVLCTYSEPHRHLIHGDCHFLNIITNCSEITGIIDWDVVKFGDFLFDIASLDTYSPGLALPKFFKAYYEKMNMKVSHFKERFLCAAYCRGIDCLRFYAKVNDEKSYTYIKKYLYSL